MRVEVTRNEQSTGDELAILLSCHQTGLPTLKLK